MDRHRRRIAELWRAGRGLWKFLALCLKLGKMNVVRFRMILSRMSCALVALLAMAQGSAAENMGTKPFRLEADRFFIADEEDRLASLETRKEKLVPQVVINDRPMLLLIGAVEAAEGYGSISNSSPISPAKPVTQMTIQEVLQFQEEMRNSGAASTAMGRYQFIQGTLAELVIENRVDPLDLFDRRMQDYLARMKMKDCGFYNESDSVAEVGNCLARVWAALPVLTGEKKGKSYYHGIAGNRALVDTSTVKVVLGDRFETEMVVATR